MTVTIQRPDGSFVSELNFSTTLTERFFNGVIPSDTISVEVSVNGSGFSDDPALVSWSDGKWTVPSPLYEPNGLTLLEGLNKIEVRAVVSTGSTTNTAVVNVTLISSSNLGVVAQPPTNFGVEQKNNAVNLYNEATSDVGLVGMNFYASLYAGGGVSGY